VLLTTTDRTRALLSNLESELCTMVSAMATAERGKAAGKGIKGNKYPPNQKFFF